jgi:hypothetical protein
MTPMLSDGLPLNRDTVRSSTAPITWSRSRMRTGYPPTLATMMLLNFGRLHVVSATTVIRAQSIRAGHFRVLPADGVDVLDGELEQPGACDRC